MARWGGEENDPIRAESQVIECSWDELQLAIKDDVRDFDALIAAHATYVTSLVARAFLDTVSKVGRARRTTQTQWAAAYLPPAQHLAIETSTGRGPRIGLADFHSQAVGAYPPVHCRPGVCPAP